MNLRLHTRFGMAKCWGIAACVMLIFLSCKGGNTIELDTPSGEKMTLELALTDEARAQGLMFRESLEKNAGMLFVFPDSAMRNFWMKNTPIPLSIAFLDVGGVVLHIADMRPYSLEAVSSVKPARFAIEVYKGNFDTLKIKKGSKLSLPDNLHAE